MKFKILFTLLALLSLSTQAVTTKNVETITAKACITEQIKGVFDGADEFGYTFILSLDDGEGVIFTFNKLESNVSTEFNLKSEDLIGQTFIISFEMVKAKSPDGDEIETNTYTITGLESVY